MRYKETVILSLLSLLSLAGCTPAASLSRPASPTLSKLGPNMQDLMHEALGLNGSSTTQPNAKLIDPNV